MAKPGRPERDPFELANAAAELWGTDAQDVGYLARVFTQTSMPYKDPGDVPVWVRRNGNRQASLTLTLQPGAPVVDRDGNITPTGYPFGSTPRLLLVWLSTEAVRTGARTLTLGESLSDFMRQLGITGITGGKTGTITRLRDQMRRLFRARITIDYHETGDTFQREATKQLGIADTYDLWWSSKAPDQPALIPSYVELSEKFFHEVTTRPVPLDMNALRLLRGSPLRLDIYGWLTYRMSYLRKPTLVSWEALLFQFGSAARTKQATYKFRSDFLSHLGQVRALAYPQAKVAEVAGGLRLLPSPPHVSRGSRPALNA